MKDETGPSIGGQTLLAFCPGARRTGWAVYVGIGLKASGVLSMPPAAGEDSPHPADVLADRLDELAQGWGAEAVVCRRRSTIGGRPSATGSLETALERWRLRSRLAWHSYTSREVRTAVSGRSNASRDALAHATMAMLGLIGDNRRFEEWEAAATGACHIRSSAVGIGG